MSNWKFKKIGKHIFIHYFITFLGEHSNVNNVIHALLCLCSCFYVQVFVVNYFEIFQNFFLGWRGGWVGCIVSKLFWIFIYFLYLQGPLITFSDVADYDIHF